MRKFNMYLSEVLGWDGDKNVMRYWGFLKIDEIYEVLDLVSKWFYIG